MVKKNRLTLKKTLPLLFSIFVAFGIIFSTQETKAFGVSPSELKVGSILHNTNRTAHITFTKIPSENGKEVPLEIDFDGPYGSYLSGAKEITIPATESNISYPFVINPGTLPNGTYEALVRAVQKSENITSNKVVKNGLSTGSKVVLGVAIRLFFTVEQKEVISYQVFKINVQDTETDDSFILSYEVRNDGNVSWRPQRIDVLFQGVDDEALTGSATFRGDTLPYVEPGLSSILSVSTTATLATGRYRALAKFFDNDKVVAELSSQPFAVFKPNTLAQSGELESTTLDQTTIKEGELLKLHGSFKNTGAIALQVILVTEIYRGKALIDVVRTNTVSVARGEDKNIEQIIKLNDSGSYRLSSYIEYGEKRTEAHEVIANVSGGFLSSPWGIATLIGIISLLIIGGASWLGIRLRRLRNNTQPLKPILPLYTLSNNKNELNAAPIQTESNDATGETKGGDSGGNQGGTL